MIYMSPLNGISVASTDSAMHETVNENVISSVAASAPAPTQSSKIPFKSNIEEDAVDTMLQKMDGMIQRKRDPKRYLTKFNNKDRAWYLIIIVLLFQLSSWRKFLLSSLFTPGALWWNLSTGTKHQAHVLSCIFAQTFQWIRSWQVRQFGKH